MSKSGRPLKKISDKTEPYTRDIREQQKKAIIDILKKILYEKTHNPTAQSITGAAIYFAESDISIITEPEGEIIYSPPLN